MAGEEPFEWDYVIVGSGAGGGALAARLAESGMRVFLLEAGGDPLKIAVDGLPADYQVPAFHASACENPAMRWDFKVRHYLDERKQARDPKYESGQGVLYPRAGALGGCTVHNAMIFMLPHDSDWDHIAGVTKDSSWRASPMRRYAKKVEACHHRPMWRALRHTGIDFSGHGWDGWLRTERAMPHEALADDELLRTVLSTARSLVTGLPLPVTRSLRWLWSRGDPNARRFRRRSYEGLCYTPLSTDRYSRTGARERLLKVAADHPRSLHIELDALVTRVTFADDGNATGVEYLKGRHLYRAHARPNADGGEPRRVRARREVILCGGAFNTPQLLMLSGIGPRQELERHGIPVRVDLPGVGRSLQDRYEVAVTHRMRQPWMVLRGARFESTDPLWRLWQESRSGIYTTNGTAMGIAWRSTRSAPEPDIFCMALLARFEGYFSGFSKMVMDHQDYLTWAVLKAHTNNRAGVITLRSTDPRDMPLVNFNYFEDGSPGADEDLQAVVNGVKFVRRITAPLIDKKLVAEESTPGMDVRTDTQIADYVRDTAWGHHASCSCAIGATSENGVLDSNFSVHGVRRLRVVDASVFPRIPGFFIVSAVYMIAEKAADVILQQAALEHPQLKSA